MKDVGHFVVQALAEMVSGNVDQEHSLQHPDFPVSREHDRLSSVR